MAESYMGSISKGAITIDSFLGINTLPGCGVNEFKKMQNMTTDYYPVMSTRPKRHRVETQIGSSQQSTSVTDIKKYVATTHGNTGMFRLHCNFKADQIEMIKGVGTVCCYLKRKCENEYSCKCYGYMGDSDEAFFINFSNHTEFDNARKALKLEKTTTGAAVEIADKDNYLEAEFFTVSIQSNIVYQDGYFYYVKNTSLVRKRPDSTEEVLIEDMFYGECRVHLSGTAVVVSPHMAVYYLATGIIRADGYGYPFCLSDVTISRPLTSRPTYQIIIKNSHKIAEGDDNNIDFTFVTKEGKIYSDMGLYADMDADGNLVSSWIEILDSEVTTDIAKKQKKFADDCLEYYGGGSSATNNRGWLKEGLFSETDPIGYIEGYTPEVGFNPKFSIFYNNRMFACNAEGNCVHSSVIGKPYDFTTLEDGEASADWIEVVSAGQFTGIAAFGGYVYYFKEHCVHKLYGSSPTDWQLVMLPVNGVEEGADKSVAVENDVCIYKSTDGFYLFDGTKSYKISGNLGRNTVLPDECEKSLSYIEYSSCIFKGKYYCSAYDRIEKKYTLYTYDTSTGLWCAEELNTGNGFYELMRTSRDVYGIKSDDSGTSLVSLCSGGEFSMDNRYETSFDWRVESGDMTLGYANNKYISKIQIRAEGEAGTEIHVKIIADRKENKSVEFEFYPDTLDSYSYSPKPIRCDNFRVLLSGTGQAKIYSITLTVSEGSEIR